MIPRAPRRIDPAALEDGLRKRGIAVHRRTIQRDLRLLARVFPLSVDGRSKPYGWGWAEPAPTLPRPHGLAASSEELR